MEAFFILFENFINPKIIESINIGSNQWSIGTPGGGGGVVGGGGGGAANKVFDMVKHKNKTIKNLFMIAFIGRKSNKKI